MLSQVLILYHESGRAQQLGVLGPLNNKTIKTSRVLFLPFVRI